MNKKHALSLLTLVLLIGIQSCSNSDATIYGTWRFNKEKSTDLASWQGRESGVTITKNDSAITISYNWQHRRSGAFVDSVTVFPGGDTSKVLITSPIWSENWFIGVLAKTNCEKKINAHWEEIDKKLVTETEQVVEVSQGETTIKTVREYHLNRRGNVLVIKEKHSSRPEPIILIFDREQPTQS